MASDKFERSLNGISTAANYWADASSTRRTETLSRRLREELLDTQSKSYAAEHSEKRSVPRVVHNIELDGDELGVEELEPLVNTQHSTLSDADANVPAVGNSLVPARRALGCSTWRRRKIAMRHVNRVRHGGADTGCQSLRLRPLGYSVLGTKLRCS